MLGCVFMNVLTSRSILFSISLARPWLVLTSSSSCSAKDWSSLFSSLRASWTSCGDTVYCVSLRVSESVFAKLSSVRVARASTPSISDLRLSASTQPRSHSTPENSFASLRSSEPSGCNEPLVCSTGYTVHIWVALAMRSISVSDGTSLTPLRLSTPACALSIESHCLRVCCSKVARTVASASPFRSASTRSRFSSSRFKRKTTCCWWASASFAA
mmetsp:Transcript_15603/g.40443  ORF Transcript_15603/g.40443 Transcript_15603/m.40443 type:complete len:215 (-) Transcript_15603:467-1111(-)